MVILQKTTAFLSSKKRILFLAAVFTLAYGLYAQSKFPAEDFWSLDAGFGMTDILVEGQSYQFVLDPKIWLSPPLLIGSRLGISYSTDEILTFEGQVYLRWNFLRLGKNPEKKVNIFLQGGLGLLAAYRGESSPFSDVTMTRGSLMADATAGVTIPLSSRWRIEPFVRGGYPHILGGGITVGYKFPLPGKGKNIVQVEYVQVIKTLPPNEIIKRIMISAVEFILFGPDISQYNVGVDHDGQGLNELVLNSISKTLKENPNLRVRIEGHANPVTTDPKEAEELMNLSAARANVVAEQLKAKGVDEEQMVVIAFGGTRTVTSERDKWDMNRRVELIVIQINTD